MDASTYNASDVFRAKLREFEQWSYAVTPEFGKAITRIIAGQKPVSFKGYGLGDFTVPDLSDIGIPLVGGGTITSANWLPASSGVSSPVDIVNNIDTMVNSLAKGYLDVMGAQAAVQGKLADLKLVAQGSAQTQAINAAAKTATGIGQSMPTAWFVLGGVGLLALILLKNK